MSEADRIADLSRANIQARAEKAAADQAALTKRALEIADGYADERLKRAQAELDAERAARGA